MDGVAGISVLVTGGTGFIGSHLTRRLVREGAIVHVLTSSVSSVYPVRLLDIRDDIVLHGGNLNDRWALDHVVAVAKPEIVFHLGAYTHVGKSWDRANECIQTNIQGSVNLFQSVSRHNLRRLVYTSTSEVYGDIEVPFREDDQVRPLSPYSVSKYGGELFCRMLHRGLGWPVVVVRPFNAYGPAQSPDRVIPETIVKALRGERLLMTRGTQTREFNYVGDLVEGFLRAATVDGIENEVINIGGGEEVAMKDMARKILKLMGDPIEAEIGALPERPTEIREMRSDSSKAVRLLGLPPPRSLDDGLTATIAWYRQELDGAMSSFSA